MIPGLFMVVCVAKRQKFALISRSSSLIHFKILKVTQENGSLDLLGLPRTSLLFLALFSWILIFNTSCENCKPILQAKINRTVSGCVKTPKDPTLEGNLVNHFNYGDHTLMEIL